MCVHWLTKEYKSKGTIKCVLSVSLSTASETWITWFRSTHHLLSDYLSSTIRLPIRLSTTIRLPFDYLSSTFQLLFDHQPNKLSILHRHQNIPKHTNNSEVVKSTNFLALTPYFSFIWAGITGTHHQCPIIATLFFIYLSWVYRQAPPSPFSGMLTPALLHLHFYGFNCKNNNQYYGQRVTPAN